MLQMGLLVSKLSGGYPPANVLSYFHHNPLSCLHNVIGSSISLCFVGAKPLPDPLLERDPEDVRTECLKKEQIVSHIEKLVQERHNSIANALELRLSCTNTSTCSYSSRLYTGPGDNNTIWHHGIWSALVQVMACLLPDDIKPLPEQMFWHHQWGTAAIG